MRPRPVRRSVPRLVPRLALALALLPAVALARAPGHDDDDDEHAPAKVYDFGDLTIDADLALPAAASLGATPGGAQDVRHFRDRVRDGEVPHPRAFTPEGLFSEHDLPLASRPCRALLCVTGEASDARLAVQPEVRWMAQIGFASGLDPATWRRAPLNLVAVVDKSGSMAGAPLETVKASLREIASRHLRAGDRLAIVLYGDRAHVHLPSTPVEQLPRILQAVDAVQSAGSTYLEDGLRVGFDLARRSARGFQGTTRVMLFTDERPNVGRTDAASFMGLADLHARAGVGLTTVGVGVQFGAELAQKVSSVRGGNLFFFAGPDEMASALAEDFDTMVTELAYDLVLEVRPAPGLKIAGMYGVPGSLLEWIDGGGLRLHVSTVFLSRRRGAILAAFAQDGGDGLPERRLAPGEAVAAVSLAYEPADGPVRSERFDLRHVETARRSEGLARGTLLVEEATALKEATRRHHEDNDQEGAWQLVHALRGELAAADDPALAPERELVEALEHTLALLSGRRGEPSPPGRDDAPSAGEDEDPPAPTAREAEPVDPVSGLPRRP